MNINESNITDLPVRTIVKQLVKIVKTRKTGEYYLPEDLNGDSIDYDFKGIPLFSIEFIYEESYSIDSPYLMTGIVTDMNTIVIKLIIHPNSYPNLLYDLIADLNDIVRHEMEHIYQDEGLRPEEEIPTKNKNNYQITNKEYYKQSHEITAQIKGLKRIAKLRNQPIEQVIEEWFIRNKETHGLDDDDIKDLTLFLTKKYKEFYGK
jgi:hypothetical protein